MLLPKVVSFLPLFVGALGSFARFSALIQRIHKESNAATVYFIGIDSEFTRNFMKTQLEIPLAIFTSQPKESNKRFSEIQALLVVQAYSENYENFGLIREFIQRLRVRKFAIVYADNLESLQRYFSYFWENKFTRIFGIADDKSYAYLPYARYPVQLLHKGDPLPDALKDLNGFAIRTTVKTDIPRTFWYPDGEGQLQIGGTFGQIFLNFLRRHNASFKEINVSRSTDLVMPEIIKATINNEIDISMNVYNIHKDLDYTYPVKVLRWVIMVPLNGYLNPNEYFLRPFSSTAWICIGVTVFYIVLMDVVKDSVIAGRVNVWQSFSRTFLIMLNWSSDPAITSAYRFHVQVLLLAFILGNVYTIYFTSFFTVFIRVKQYDTVQDLIDNEVPVMFPVFEMTLLPDGIVGLKEIAVLVDYPEYYRARNSMNTSFAYSIGEDKADFLIGLQAYLGNLLFHTTSDGLRNALLTFLLVEHSPFKEILSNFNILIMETGLITKWDYDAIVQAHKAGFKVDVGQKRGGRYYTQVIVDDLRFAWICFAAGLTLAVVVFLGEVASRAVRRFWNLRKK